MQLNCPHPNANWSQKKQVYECSTCGATWNQTFGIRGPGPGELYSSNPLGKVEVPGPLEEVPLPALFDELMRRTDFGFVALLVKGVPMFAHKGHWSITRSMVIDSVMQADEQNRRDV